MVLCRYFQQGSCRFGTKCNNEHFDLKQILKTDVESSINGKMWPFSCYGPFKDKPSLPNFIEDQSVEEVRWLCYQSKGQNFEQFHQQFNKEVMEATNKMKALLHVTPQILEVVIKVYDTPIIDTVKPPVNNNNNNPFGFGTGNAAATNSIFNKPTANTGSIFGGGGAGSAFSSQQPTLGQQQGSNIFGAASTAANPAASIFGGGGGGGNVFAQQQQTSIFAQQPQTQPSLFAQQQSQPQPQQQQPPQSVFGQQQPTATPFQSSNIFAQAAQPKIVSTFGQPQPQSSFVGGFQQQQPQQQQSVGGMFGQPPAAIIVPNSGNIFQQTSAVPPPSAFFSQATQQQPQHQIQAQQPMQESAAIQQQPRDSASCYSLLENLSAAEIEAFKAEQFMPGNLPFSPPPREFIN
ncbi:nucleoporin-like protein amo1 [Scaptodrosophila lebanonensis]|uniref:Nucleoporin NUP42 n=1 Tax=Drosophila lebanonensis TaxID=7225 RepID=A0A6J2UB68_DROLE|nr:nucleoporin-like protein amo1 [Scaptodrosophila lebanonensis]